MKAPYLRPAERLMYPICDTATATMESTFRGALMLSSGCWSAMGYVSSPVTRVVDEDVVGSFQLPIEKGIKSKMSS